MLNFGGVLGGVFFFEFSPPHLGKSNLTSIFFKWVETTNRLNAGWYTLHWSYGIVTSDFCFSFWFAKHLILCSQRIKRKSATFPIYQVKESATSRKIDGWKTIYLLGFGPCSGANFYTPRNLTYTTQNGHLLKRSPPFPRPIILGIQPLVCRGCRAFREAPRSTNRGKTQCHLSHEKKPSYFPWNPGWLTGIFISWFIRIPIYLGLLG